ncbi:MAG: ribosome small subunit-dependent GTPase A [Flavobacteriales bacterium]|nr:ribosome small subunit-dependent GTPase A [Flavobacteriales bacterium]
MKGVVVKSTGGTCWVKDESGDRHECVIRGKFRMKNIRDTNPVAVGDFVEFNKEEGLSQITEIGKRKNYIIRKSINLSKQTQILAANIDQVLLLVTLEQPGTSTGFIDRFLVSAEAYQIPAIILFNKVDVYDEEGLEKMRTLKEVYSTIGYQCFETSLHDKKSKGLVERLINGKINVVSGHSGVGKSSMINQLDPSLDIRTGEISEYHQTGTHVTTFAEMHEVSENTFIIDTPGIKSFGIIDMAKEELSRYFIEMMAVLDGCKFNNCQHINEPKCAVKDAVEAGTISESRYKNYIEIYYTDESETYRKNNYV